MQKSQRLLQLQNVFTNHVKLMSATRTIIKLDEKVSQDIENVVYKPRRHPGVMKYKSVQMPSEIVKAIEASTQDFPMKRLVHDGESLNRYLKARHPPNTNDELTAKYSEVERKIMSNKKYDFSNLPEDERNRMEKNLHNEIIQKCKTQLYGWKPITYDDFTALTYLFGRSPQEYAVLMRIFGELKDRMPEFKPRSFLDFGSGVGTGTWAVRNIFQNSIFEYFCVDSSSSMNDLADIILRGGRGNKANPLKLISYRQFLPASNELKYDIVLSAYTLFEMHSPEVRLEKLLNLWNKTEQYLVIVELGTNAGFRLVAEARDFLLNYDAEVFAPCPHIKPCPRFMTDNTPCNFEVKYFTLPLAAVSKVRQELFSYVVLRKKTAGLINTNYVSQNTTFKENVRDMGNIDSKSENIEKVGIVKDNVKIESFDSSKWPRIVRPTLVRSKHTVCRMCTSEGCLKEVVVTAAKHGKKEYHCVRSSNWGDLLPITMYDVEKPKTNKVKEENPKINVVQNVEDDEKDVKCDAQ